MQIALLLPLPAIDTRLLEPSVYLHTPQQHRQTAASVKHMRSQ
jgi:hypothetical protein